MTVTEVKSSFIMAEKHPELRRLHIFPVTTYHASFVEKPNILCFYHTKARWLQGTAHTFKT